MMSPDCVVLEVAQLDLPDDGMANLDKLWEEADEQQLPTDLRRRLASSGLRCGVIGCQLPDWIRRNLEESDRSIELGPDRRSATINDSRTQWRVQCRPGKRSPIPVGGQRESLTVNDGSQPVTPATYEDAQCQFSLTAKPAGDGTVALELTPEIYYGPSHQCWVPQDGMFRIDSTRDCERFEDLLIETVLSPGQTLVLSASPHPTGLGVAFFDDAVKSRHRQTVLLIRLAQTQLDDLFAPDRSLTPIASPP